MNHVILIPAYNPDFRLIHLITELVELKMPIIIVNDGSDKQCESIFSAIKDAYEVDVIEHEVNRGKGAAIKTGISYISHHYSNCTGVITADADGQHLTKDIKKISTLVTQNPKFLILGVRNFNKPNIPLRSKLGNKITSFIFYLSTQIKCPDTQTGLRGVSRELFNKCLKIPGERYEYEMNMLMQFARDQIGFVYEEINTIYINGNDSSHFNPIVDSIKIYFNILKFSFASLMSSVVDLVSFSLLMSLFDVNLFENLLLATIGSRMISGVFNFVINKWWVFSNQANVRKQGIKYMGLFLIIMMTSFTGVSLLSFLPIPLILIKVIVDGGLFIFSYNIQKKYIFNDRRVQKKCID